MAERYVTIANEKGYNCKEYRQALTSRVLSKNHGSSCTPDPSSQITNPSLNNPQLCRGQTETIQSYDNRGNSHV